MKQIIISLLAIIALAACSDIDTADRLIGVEGVKPERTIIIEDFTGQNCVNCPAAHEVLDQLVEQYPDNIIPVSIHAGHFAVPVDHPLGGLMEPEGNDLCDRWGIRSFPMGVINRTGSPLEAKDWATAVRQQLETPSNVAFTDFEAVADPAGDNIAITFTIKPEVTIQATLHVWVVESGIVAYQLNTTGRIPDYVHNNVYRASVNTVEGQTVELTDHIYSTFEFEQSVRKLDYETWNLDNLAIVAFLETPSGVLQAAKTKVTTSATANE